MVGENVNIQELNTLFSKAKFIDLSPLLENDMPRFPTHPPFVVNPTVTHEHDGYYCQTVFMAEHTGAHVDAPYHVHIKLKEKTVETLPLNALLGHGIVLDLSKLNLAAGEFATLDDIKRAEKVTNVEIKEGDIVLVNFGWMKYRTTKGDWKKYAGNSPGLDKSVAEYLLAKKIKALGSDTIACGTASINCESKFCWIHELLLSNDIYLLECLANLEQLPAEIFFMALPLKIKNGSGSPIRPVALSYD
ncbi:cyclase family protein [Moorella sp. Hama-1]|uniref:cyclase family protein n=1 Tax=Moorella sp. Hama-1 TaxID=2138101 RepID=UPI000D64F887|nr:cyclase family protein [Moorella sp. Hama-1]BCV21393.1 metal-dependent hydrolase [Moorella sp. Hama-1]